MTSFIISDRVIRGGDGVGALSLRTGCVVSGISHIPLGLQEPVIINLLCLITLTSHFENRARQSSSYILPIDIKETVFKYLNMKLCCSFFIVQGQGVQWLGYVELSHFH